MKHLYNPSKGYLALLQLREIPVPGTIAGSFVDGSAPPRHDRPLECRLPVVAPPDLEHGARIETPAFGRRVLPLLRRREHGDLHVLPTVSELVDKDGIDDTRGRTGRRPGTDSNGSEGKTDQIFFSSGITTLSISIVPSPSNPCRTIALILVRSSPGKSDIGTRTVFHFRRTLT